MSEKVRLYRKPNFWLVVIVILMVVIIGLIIFGLIIFWVIQSQKLAVAKESLQTPLITTCSAPNDSGIVTESGVELVWDSQACKYHARSAVVVQPTETVVISTTVPTPTVEITVEAKPTVFVEKSALFQSPVEAKETFNKESAWLIAEPGSILDNTAAWTIPGTQATWYINVPEGGFTFFSMGQGVIEVADIRIDMPWIAGNNYLIVIRGSIDDGIFDNDLNKTAAITDFKPGHAIWAIMKPGAYISKSWFYDQMVVSTTTGGTNCGATGCSKLTVINVDIDSGLVQKFVVKASALNDWTLIK